MRKPVILCVVGTRPEAIKMAPVVIGLRARDDLSALIVSTGQHRDLVAPQLAHFGLVPDIDLGIAADGRTLAGQLGRLLEALDTCLATALPDLVIGQGDTLSAFAAALSAFYRQIPFAHVEAGLRTDRLDSPFPEEMHRRAIALATRLHFAPTRSAANRLATEGVPADRILITGNSVIDALFHVTARQEPTRAARASFLFTLHRRESVDMADDILAAVGRIALERPDIDVVYPVHPNPAFHDRAHSQLGRIANVRLTQPLDYPDLVAAMAASLFVVTDSGGLQEEAPALGKPVLVLREVSERMEAVESGAALLIGTNGDRIVRETLRLIDCADSRARMAIGGSPYGDGRAGTRIASACARYLGAARDIPIDAFG
ncbi:non-hydrolyzing UDP-N-acetylglucosamine 2-epimerase [Sphingomonas montanisoli]|uniref:UDP-N-acetylglucosamine 2-epimerase (non-hydrolyzing) n=1 Tax=Sphingomonas montanisoli TaxID=2606412 RepID=A0A5D9C7W2_9SPHN|nr:UDP-N-acetylglucosamine 2-epimerase (non-hydrolyzing) [Sphingomonas montanisoli]TZG27347.1 UDP-N-acetylglucosamine 2-epimerase (non-hydrolyzing) [Sphingomonas montanisoli]